MSKKGTNTVDTIEEIRYFTKELLVSLNEKAITAQADLHLPRRLVKALPDGKRFPVVAHSMKGQFVSIMVGINARGDIEFIDIPVADFHLLPIFDFGDVTYH